MRYIVKHKWLFYLIQYTWGIIMNLIGLIVSLVLLCSKHKPKKFGNGWYFTVGENWGGLELGVCFLCGKQNDNEHIRCHESGHGLQNILWGPLFPFVVCIPSAIRYWYRELKYERKGKIPPTEYDDIWFEGQATKWGYKYYGGQDGNNK